MALSPSFLDRSAAAGATCGVEAQDHADVVLTVLVLAHDLLVVGVDEEGQRDPVGARRLDDMGI